MPFLGAHSGVGAWGIDQGNQGQTEFFRQSHQSKSLAIPLRVSATKITSNVFFGISSLLMGHHHTTELANRGEATGHRLVVAKEPITMKLQVIGERCIQI